METDNHSSNNYLSGEIVIHHESRNLHTNEALDYISVVKVFSYTVI